MTPIERFCGLADDCSQQPSSKLEEKLGFSPDADRIALIRRTHFDLLDLPLAPSGRLVIDPGE